MRYVMGTDLFHSCTSGLVRLSRNSSVKGVSGGDWSACGPKSKLAALRALERAKGTFEFELPPYLERSFDTLESNEGEDAVPLQPCIVIRFFVSDTVLKRSLEQFKCCVEPSLRALKPRLLPTGLACLGSPPLLFGR